MNYKWMALQPHDIRPDREQEEADLGHGETSVAGYTCSCDNKAHEGCKCVELSNNNFIHVFRNLRKLVSISNSSISATKGRKKKSIVYQ